MRQSHFQLAIDMDCHPVDGLIVMIDAGETQEGLTGASQRLTDRTVLAAERIELLVARPRERP